MLLDAALQLITVLAQGILDAMPVLIAALPEIINGIITFLLDSIPQIIETGIQLLTLTGSRIAGHHHGDRGSHPEKSLTALSKRC